MHHFRHIKVLFALSKGVCFKMYFNMGRHAIKAYNFSKLCYVHDVLRNCNVSTVKPTSSLNWFSVSTLYVSLD